MRVSNGKNMMHLHHYNRLKDTRIYMKESYKVS